MICKVCGNQMKLMWFAPTPQKLGNKPYVATYKCWICDLTVTTRASAEEICNEAEDEKHLPRQ